MFGAIVAAMTLVSAPPQNGFLIDCQTKICEQAVAEVEALPRAPRNRAYDRMSRCIDYNRQLGVRINDLSYETTRRYNVGAIGYDQASDIRTIYYTETYIVREHMRMAMQDGDADRCERIMHVGFRVLGTLRNRLMR